MRKRRCFRPSRTTKITSGRPSDRRSASRPRPANNSRRSISLICSPHRKADNAPAPVTSSCEVSQMAYDTFAASALRVSSTLVRTSSGGGRPSLSASSTAVYSLLRLHVASLDKGLSWKLTLGCVLSHLMDFNVGWFRLRLSARPCFPSPLDLVSVRGFRTRGQSPGVRFPASSLTQGKDESVGEKAAFFFPSDDWVHGLFGCRLLPWSSRLGLVGWP